MGKVSSAPDVKSSPHMSAKGNLHQYQNQQKPASKPAVQSQSSVFRLYDVAETSYHFYVGQIDLHLCDDASGEIGRFLLLFWLYLTVCDDKCAISDCGFSLSI